MARPSNTNSTDTQQRILEAASRQFSTAGVDGCSIRDIAKAVDLSVATIHHHFGSKQGLYQACLDSMYVALSALRGTLMPVFAATPEEMLHQVVRTSWRFCRAHRLQLRLLMREVVSHGGLDSVRREAHLVPFLAQGSIVLGNFAGRDPKEMRLVLQSSINLLVRYALGHDEEHFTLTGLRGPAAEQVIENHLVEAITTLVKRDTSS